MKCPCCNQEITKAFPSSPMWMRELNYMVNRGWLFSETLRDDRWKSDPDLERFLKNGWVEMCPTRGFQITQFGIEFLKAKGFTIPETTNPRER